jgi:hypothetical protein
MRPEVFLSEDLDFSPELLSHVVVRLMESIRPIDVGVRHICKSHDCSSSVIDEEDKNWGINVFWCWSKGFSDWILFAHDVTQKLLWAFHPTVQGKSGTESGQIAFQSFHNNRAVSKKNGKKPKLLNRQINCSMSSAISLLCVFEEIIVCGHIPSSVPLPVDREYEADYCKLIGYFVSCL